MLGVPSGVIEGVRLLVVVGKAVHSVRFPATTIAVVRRRFLA
jgi:hypothetical protein